MATIKTQNRFFKTMTQLTNIFNLCDKLYIFMVNKSDGTIKQTVNYLCFMLYQMYNRI